MTESARIMIVEDEGIIARDLELTLRRLGYTVSSVVDNARSAIDDVARLRPDLVLMDIVLRGEMDGIDAANLIRFSHNVPVVYLTAYADEALIDRAKLTEPIGYILKPYEANELRASIELALYQYRTGRQRAETRIRSMLESAPDGMLLARADGTIELVNRSLVAMFGYTPDELVGAPVELLIPEGARARHAAHRAAYAAAPRSRPMGGGVELSGRRKDGTELPVDISLSNIEGVEGQHVMAIVRDISERRKAEASLHEERERFRTTFELAAVGIGHVGLDGRWIVVNPRLAALLGRDDLVGVAVSSLVHPDDRTATPTLESVVRGEVAMLSAVRRLRHSSGGLVWTHLSASLVRDPAGTPLYAILVVEDITERKRGEHNLNEQQKMNAIGRLAAGVAHDLNNILTTVTCLVDLMDERHRDDPEHRGDVAELRSASARAATLTGQLLAFGRRQMLSPRVIDLNDIVAGMEQMLRRLLPEHVRLTLVLAPDLAKTHADPAQIEQILMNLCVNARDAMPQGGSITIETANVELDAARVLLHGASTSGPHALLSVSDTGSGMDAETRAHLFEPFFTTKPQGKGTGLGLATVYGIVKQSGGCISVYSEVGAGSTFKVFLPATSALAEVRESVLPPRARRRGWETVLLVEDEPTVHAIGARILRAAGYTVLVARHGKEALDVALAHEGEIHLLFTDAVMPEMGGKELSERLCALRPGLRVLYSSGYTDTSIVLNGVIDADVAFLPKPYTAAALTDKVREVLDGPAPAKPAA